jgi:hypothetical protein
MWTALFPLALAASIWFSAVNLTVQLDKARATMSAASHATYGNVVATNAAGSRLD